MTPLDTILLIAWTLSQAFAIATLVVAIRVAGRSTVPAMGMTALAGVLAVYPVIAMMGMEAAWFAGAALPAMLVLLWVVDGGGLAGSPHRRAGAALAVSLAHLGVTLGLFLVLLRNFDVPYPDGPPIPTPD